MTRNNNFDLLRFLLAGMVVLFHGYVLSRNEQLVLLPRFFSADIAVKGFFVVSGYLILRSWDTSAGLADYASKRARRIYPAYATVVLSCALVGAVVSYMPLSRYFSWQWLRYLGANLVFLNFLGPTLPGVFTGNPESAVNGALWTLKIEVMFYAIVPVLGWLIRRYGPVATSLTIYLASVTYALALFHLADVSARPIFATLAQQLPGQLSFFMSGALLYYKESAARRWLPFTAPVSILLLAWGGPLVDGVLRPMLLALTIIYFAVAFPYLGNFGRFGDFSYGIYIIHFPVIQWLVWAGWFRSAPWLSLLLACGLVTAGAFVCWHLVERRFLLRSSHYLRTSKADPETLATTTGT